MENIHHKSVLISGASIAGLSTAYWLQKVGYKVTVVEAAKQFRTDGGAINIEGQGVNVIRRMGIFDAIKANRIVAERIEFKNKFDVTEGSIDLFPIGSGPSDEDFEIERDKFVQILVESLNNKVDFIFGNHITGLTETNDSMQVLFKDGKQQAFHLVIGCDGMHSGVRRLWFGPETNYSYFLGGYFSITIFNGLLVEQKTMQMYNEPDRCLMLNAYNNKTDIIYCFNSDEEIVYDYRNQEEQRQIISDRFAGFGWRSAELMQLVKDSPGFYFDKFCQIRMDRWTKGRVALTGDAAYCPSPAAGKGGSLAIIGAAALADALIACYGDYGSAFLNYENNLRPLLQDVQARAEINVIEIIPRTHEAIGERNAGGFKLQ